LQVRQLGVSMAEIGRIADVTEPPTMNRSHLRPNAPILSAAAA